MAAYHLEALRRQRVIDRKHTALAKIADLKVRKYNFILSREAC